MSKVMMCDDKSLLLSKTVFCCSLLPICILVSIVFASLIRFCLHSLWCSTISDTNEKRSRVSIWLSRAWTSLYLLSQLDDMNLQIERISDEEALDEPPVPHFITRRNVTLDNCDFWVVTLSTRHNLLHESSFMSKRGSWFTTASIFFLCTLPMAFFLFLLRANVIAPHREVYTNLARLSEAFS